MAETGGKASQKAKVVRYLVLSGEEQLDAARALVGQRYTCVTRHQAMTNGVGEVLRKTPVLCWPSEAKTAFIDMHLFAQELANDGVPEVKFLDADTGWQPSDFIARGQDFAFFKDLAHKLDRVQIITPSERVSTNISPINAGSPSAPVALAPPVSAAEPEGGPAPYSDSPESISLDYALEQSTHGDPPLPPGESEPYWLRDAPPDHDSGPPAVFHPGRAGRVYADYESGSSASDWPDPLDFWGTEGLPHLTPDMMPDAFASYVLDSANRAGLDAPQVALNCWVVCASLIRRGIAVNMQAEAREGRTWREKPILWGAVIGLASTGKGPGMDIAIDHFRQIASDLRRKDESAWQQYEHAAKTHDIAMQGYYREAAKNPHVPMPEAPQKPPKERLWTEDATKESVARLLTENPRGKITIIRDELASWFGSFGAYGPGGKAEKDRGDWLSFYESKERYIDRVGPGASYHVESWGGCILGGIQPEVLAKVSAILGPDGMLQRFMLIVNRAKTRPPKREPDYAAIRAWNGLLDNLAAMEPRGNPIALSPDAAEFMDQCGDWITNATQAGLSPGLDAALGKWEGLIGRLAVTAHCIADAARGSTVPGPEISLATMEQCWRWMHGMLWPHLLHYYGGTMEASPMDKSVRAFADFVLARDIEEIKPHALASTWTHYRREIRTIQQRREFWDAVCLTGWVKAVGGMDRTGNIAGLYRVHPRAHTIFVHRKAIAKVQAQKYREIAHPSFQAQQGREPGVD